MTAIGRGRVAIGVATALLILRPPAGAAGGVYAGFEFARPDQPVDCGLWVLPGLLVIGAGAVLGLVAGIGAAGLIARGLFRWANGCGLADIRDDGGML